VTADDQAWHLLAALADPDDQFATWHRQLRDLHVANGGNAAGAQHVAFRQARICQWLAEGDDEDVVHARLGCSQDTFRADLRAIAEMLRPRYIPERKAA
jgi:hypothetical protein